ncbi:MAG: PilZ domain-containing protein [Polyangiaceae bacterium]|nr:PilZ domain-containing protein [Polyangiaceae bacterium]
MLPQKDPALAMTALRISSSLPPHAQASRPGRFTLSLRASFRFSQGVSWGVSENISVQGLFLLTQTLLEIGTAIELELFIPGQSIVEAKGVVRWRRFPDEFTGEGAGLGIEIQELSQKRRLQEYLLQQNGAPTPRSL